MHSLVAGVWKAVENLPERSLAGVLRGKVCITVIENNDKNVTLHFTLNTTWGNIFYISDKEAKKYKKFSSKSQRCLVTELKKSKRFKLLYSIYFGIINAEIKKVDHRHCGFLANAAFATSLFPKGAENNLLMVANC